MLNIGVLFKKYFNDKDKIFDRLKDLGVNPFDCTDGVSPSMCRSEIGDTDKRRDAVCTTDFILCFGGDGTILRSITHALKHNAPILGVNFGKLGFLSDINYKELHKSIDALKNNNYKLEQRMLLDIKVIRNNLTIFQGNALNEAALVKAHDSKLIKLNLYANRQLVYNTRSDGIIISTPTGSTAYSMSAGGPIVAPNIHVIIATPLNSHMLGMRPIIFNEDDKLEIKIPENHKIYLQSDGNIKCEILSDDKVFICKSESIVNFVKLKQKTFYGILRRKLKIGS